MTTDLVAVTATTDPDDGDIVVARLGGRGEIVCGELHRGANNTLELRTTRNKDRPAPIVMNTPDANVRIEGIILGAATFQSL